MRPYIDPPNFGSILQRHIRKYRYYKSALARDIGMRRESLADLLKRPDSRLSSIWKICFALNYNFIADIAEQLPSDMPCAPSAKDKRIAELEEQLEALRAECRTLERIVEVLRMK